MRQNIKKRIFKKRLRRLEADLGSSIKLYGTDVSNSEFQGRLDFWVSYYVSWLLRNTELSKELWCDGSVWDKDHHIMEFKRVSKLQYFLKCKLDLQDDNSTYSGNLEATFEYDPKFKKFATYMVKLSVVNSNHVFSSQ